MTVVAAGGRWLRLDGDRIVETGTGGNGGDELDGVLVPGFLDLQINGTGDVDFSTAAPEDWRRAADRLLDCGVTGFCPTFVTAPLDAFVRRVDSAAEARVVLGSLLLGVHLEGPFLGGAPGAHQREHLRAADGPWLVDLLARHPGLVRIVTLAPEADPGLDVTRALAAAGVVVSVGHSTATYDEAIAAADAGARMVTHLFNGMSPLHHREPGVPGAALTDERLTPGLIADLVHVHPGAVRLAVAAKRSVVLVSDAVGITSGRSSGRGVEERDGAPRLPDGTLAGSSLTLDRAVRNVCGLGVSLERAVEMVTEVPAALLGLRDRGRLDVGCRADVVLLDPVSVEVRAVWLGGERVR
jgi:N-acetylglucosamine-6-phosphate deacetylase